MPHQLPIKTLLVEDDPDLIDIAVELLELMGCAVTPVNVPEEALHCMESDDGFNLLFTDYRFASALSGIDLADRMTNRSPQTKVILATGFDRDKIESRLRQDYHLIAKPYLLEDLKHLLQQLFPTLPPC